MTCRHCIRAQLNRCPKTVRYFPDQIKEIPREELRPDPLILVNSAGEKFKAFFHCRPLPCNMTIEKMGSSGLLGK